MRKYLRHICRSQGVAWPTLFTRVKTRTRGDMIRKRVAKLGTLLSRVHTAVNPERFIPNRAAPEGHSLTTTMTGLWRSLPLLLMAALLTGCAPTNPPLNQSTATTVTGNSVDIVAVLSGANLYRVVDSNGVTCYITIGIYANGVSCLPSR